MATSSRCQRARFAQEASERRIAGLEKELEAVCAKKIAEGGNVLDEDIRKLEDELKREKQALKRKIQNAENQKKFRDSKKMKLDQLCSENPEIKRKLALRDAVGRPSLHQDQPDLMKAIADIAMCGSEPDPNGSFLQSKRTLEELTLELNRLGFNISRSATYLRLLPRNASTPEGARHVNTVPVKLCRTHDIQRPHPDGPFAAASIRNLETVASLLGPLQVLYLSQFDKARVPLGVASERKKSPLLMHMEYQAALPDLEWMEAERRKLIPSVYAGIQIEERKMGHPDAISSAGPTYIAIRSGMNPPSANMHAQDLECVLDLEEFKPLVKTKDGFVKPVVIIVVDGGPDESPRYEKVIRFAAKFFKDNSLDGLFIAANTPERKYSKVELRMASLGREVGGLIIPQDHFLGSLLDTQGIETEDLERGKFEGAGKILAQVWSSMKIDDHPVRASYFGPDLEVINDLPEYPDAKWYAQHVRESQYLLQITKCSETTCCSAPRSALFRILRERFLPPPLKVMQSTEDLLLNEQGDFVDLHVQLLLNISPEVEGVLQVPYDYMCPTVKPLLPSRTCNVCGLYYASIKSLTRHLKSIHPEAPVPPTPKITPTQIGAKRANEVLCILADDNGFSDVEWREETEVNTVSKAKRSSSSFETFGKNLRYNVNSWVKSACAD